VIVLGLDAKTHLRKAALTGGVRLSQGKRGFSYHALERVENSRAAVEEQTSAIALISLSGSVQTLSHIWFGLSGAGWHSLSLGTGSGFGLGKS
jgi:hypothetical protein